MRTFWQDARYGTRLLRRSPGFTATALAAIALATGANTAVFSLVYSVVLRPLPFPDPSRLVSITQFFPLMNLSAVSSPVFLDWRDGTGAASARVAAYSLGDFTLSGSDLAERVPVATVTHEFFDVLGVRPMRGRTFSPEEDKPGSDGVALVSEGFWNDRFGGDASMARRRIELDGRSYSIIGVIPAMSQFPPAVRIWVPLALDPVRERQGGPMQLVRVIGRLRAGTTEPALAATLRAISERSPQAWSAGARIQIVPLRAWLTGKTQQIWFVLLGAAGLVLLIACGNVAGLLIARGAVRRREMAIRLALGAPSGRLMRQLLTESLLLGLAGSLIGLALAAGLFRAMLPLIPDAMLAGRVARLDTPAFAFTVALAMITALLFGAAPAREAVRVHISESLKQGGHTAPGGGVRLRSALVVAEIALGLALLVAATLMVRSFAALAAVDPGFQPDHLLTFIVNLPHAAYRETSRQQQWVTNAIEAAASLRGVQAAAVVSALPFSGSGAGRALVTADGEAPWGASEGERHRVETVFVSADYFRTMGIPWLDGRDFSANEMTPRGEAVVVNEALARRFFGTRSAAGRRIKIGLAESPAPWLTVVGVVRDFARTALDDEVAPAVFRPYHQSANLRSAGFVLRSGAEPAKLAEPVRRALATLDRDVAVSDVQPMERRLSASMASPRLRSAAAALLASLALVIVLTGLYGVLSYLVAQRSAELGVRMALGATGPHIFRLVLWRGALLAVAGIFAGAVLSLAATQFLRGLLFRVTSADPLTLAGASLAMLAVAMAASIGPARRATRIDPIRCLREE